MVDAGRITPTWRRTNVRESTFDHRLRETFQFYPALHTIWAGYGVDVISVDKHSRRESMHKWGQYGLVLGVGLIAVALLLTWARPTRSAANEGSASTLPEGWSQRAAGTSPSGLQAGRLQARALAGTNAAALTPEQHVANLLQRFVVSRREILDRFAAKTGLETPPEYREFLNLLEQGDWETIHKEFLRLSEQRKTEPFSQARLTLWPVLFEAYGVAEVAKEWPAQDLLDYGKRVLDAVPTGGIYVGGTDEGRFIPTLLNNASEEPRIVLTQNALADKTYMEYLQFLYGTAIQFPTEQQEAQAFQQIVQRLGKKTEDNRIEIGGQQAVMAINSLLVQTMARNNPGVPFAIQESYPLEETYTGAQLTGPLYTYTEPAPGSGDATKSSEAPAAATPSQVVNYWQDTVKQLQSDTGLDLSDLTRNAYAKLAMGQANILMAQGNFTEAELTLKLASDLSPSFAESTLKLAAIYSQSGRKTDALELIDTAILHAEKRAQDPSSPLEQFRRLRAELLAPKP